MNSILVAMIMSGVFFIFALWCAIRANHEGETRLAVFFFIFAFAFEGILILLA